MQDILRERLIKFFNETGTKQKFVADKIDLPVSVLSRFKTYQKDLTRSSFENLDTFLKNHGY